MIEFEEVAPGVFSVAHDFVEGKNAIVIGHRAALAIDGGNYAEEGAAMAAFIRNRGLAPDRLALTHGHGDHILGAVPLAGGEVFAHANTPAVIRRQIPMWAKRWEVEPAEAERRVVRPTVTFSDELSIDLDGKSVRLFPTPGHSADGVSALVLEDGVLIGGDAVVTGIVPAIGDGDSRQLEASLRSLLSVAELEVLVPGHGPVIHGREEARDWIRWEADYLAAVRDRVRASLKEGSSSSAAVEAVGYDEFVSDRLPRDRHNMPKRHRHTVVKIVAEEEAWQLR